MQLKIVTSIKNSIISVELETINFSGTENKMLDQFGEPIYHLEAIYQQEFAVSIHKKIRSNFKVKVRFDGTKDIDKASLAVNEFIDQIKEEIPIFMDQYIDKVEFIDLKAGVDIVDITNVFIPPVLPRHPQM